MVESGGTYTSAIERKIDVFSYYLYALSYEDVPLAAVEYAGVGV